jgi:hypothetical protein
MNCPPFIDMLLLVMKSEWFPTKKLTAFAISSGLPIGMSSTMALIIFKGNLLTISVLIYLGEIAFTVTLVSKYKGNFNFEI